LALLGPWQEHVGEQRDYYLLRNRQLTLVEPQTGLSIRKPADAVGSAWNVEVCGLDVGRLRDTAPAPVIEPYWRDS